MLTVTIPGQELYNSETNEIYTTKSYTLKLEHSLVSISKWESKWQKVFLNNKEKTTVEALDYVRCMTLTQNVPIEVYGRIPPKVTALITDYMNSPQSATKIPSRGKAAKDVMSSEMIYYLMVANSIPFEAQKWHIHRLLNLLKICGIKNAPKGKSKRSTADIARSNRERNEQRKAAMKSKG